MLSLQQKKAIELFFQIISDEHMNLGLTISHNVNGFTYELPVTRVMVKELIWKPVQESLFNTTSTSDLDTYQLNQMIDIFIKFFGERGVQIQFPNE